MIKLVLCRLLCSLTSPHLLIDTSQDGLKLIAIYADGMARLWHVERGECLRTLHGVGLDNASLIFSVDGCLDMQRKM